jgi:chromosome segregation ATPase
MTQSNQDLPQQVTRLENEQIDLKLAVSSLLAVVERHQAYHETSQRNFEAIVAEIRSMRADMQEMQSEVRGLQVENRRILDVLQNREDDHGD